MYLITVMSNGTTAQWEYSLLVLIEGTVEFRRYGQWSKFGAVLELA
jgi:phosphoserine aminotransferase